MGVRVLLIHGVGEHSVTDLRAGVAALLSTESQVPVISGLDWSTKAAVPISFTGTVSLGYLAHLVRATRAAARKNIARSVTSGADSRMIDAASSLLDRALLWAPLAALLALLNRFPGALPVIVPASIVRSAGRWIHLAIVSWFVLVFAISLVLLAFTILRRREVSVVAGMRRVILHLLRPILTLSLLPLTLNLLVAGGQLDRALGPPEFRPVEHAHRQVDDAPVPAHQLVFETELLPPALALHQFLALAQRLLEHRLVQLPRPMLIGVGQGGLKWPHCQDHFSTAISYGSAGLI